MTVSNTEYAADCAHGRMSKVFQPHELPKFKIKVCMIKKSLRALKKPGGATEEAIWKYMQKKFGLRRKQKKTVSAKLRRLTQTGALTQQGLIYRLNSARISTLQQSNSNEAKSTLANNAFFQDPLAADLQSSTGLRRLHEDIVDFAERADPSVKERNQTAALVERIQRVVSEVWGPGAGVCLFGSRAQGLSLPSSDVDLSLTSLTTSLSRPSTGPPDYRSRGRVESLLSQLSGVLRARGLVRGARVIPARVPLLKCMDTTSNLSMDITLATHDGAQMVTFVQDHTRRYPALRPLCLVVKALLSQRGLNEVYSGGLSSYAVVNLVLAHLQSQESQHRHASQSSSSSSSYPVASTSSPTPVSPPHSRGVDPAPSTRGAGPGVTRPGTVRSWTWEEGHEDLGGLLLSFLRRYGKSMEWRQWAVSVGRAQGRGFVRREEVLGEVGEDNQEAEEQKEAGSSGVRLVIEDPQELGKDIGRGSYRIQEVRKAFSEAYDVLVERCGTNLASSSILNTIIRVEEAVGRNSALVASFAIAAKLQAEFRSMATTSPRKIAESSSCQNLVSREVSDCEDRKSSKGNLLRCSSDKALHISNRLKPCESN